MDPTELPPKFNENNKRICVYCPEGMYAKNMCREHYMRHRGGNLNPENGEAIRKPGRQPKGDGPATSAAWQKEVPDQWIYVVSKSEFVNIRDARRIPYQLAVRAWSASVVHELVAEQRVINVWTDFFDPQKTPGLSQDKSTFNIWNPEKIILPPDEGGSGEQLHPYLKKLLSNLGGEDTDYLIKWLAYGLQFPGEPTVALVLHGVPGAGKGTLLSVLKEVYGPYIHTVNAWTLENEFNHWIENKLLIVADEISIKASKEREKIRNILKTYVVTGPIEINKKGVNQYSANNWSRWIICSNENQPVDIEVNDRRYSVLKQDSPIDPSLGATISSMAKELAKNLVSYLGDVDLTGFSPMKPLENKAREDMKNSLAKVYKLKNLVG